MSSLDDINFPPNFDGFEWNSSKIDEFNNKHPPFYLKIRRPQPIKELREFVRQRYVNKDLRKHDIDLDLSDHYVNYKRNQKSKLR